jgi:hypothetical protein
MNDPDLLDRLRAVLRWAHAQGWRPEPKRQLLPGVRTWLLRAPDGERRQRIIVGPDGVISVWATRGPDHITWQSRAHLTADDPQQAIDLLAAMRIVPERHSSAHAAGRRAGYQRGNRAGYYRGHR